LISSGVAGGIAACISRAAGAGNICDQKKYSRNGLVASAVVGAALCCGALGFANCLIDGFCCSHEAAAYAASYMRLVSLSNFPYAIMQAQAAIFRGLGRSGSALYLWLIPAIVEIAGTQYTFQTASCHVHLNLDSLAIYWNMGCFLSVAVGFILLKRQHGPPESQVPQAALLVESRTFLRGRQFNTRLTSQTRIGMRNPGTFVDWLFVRRIMSIGAPLIVGEAAIILANLLIYKLIAILPDGLLWQAAWAIKGRIEETFVVSPLVALSLAVAVSTGYGLGAGKKSKALNSASQCAWLAVSVMIGLALASTVMAPALVSLFCHQGELQKCSALVLSISAMSWPALSVTVVLFGALEGIGNTFKPAAFTASTQFVLRALLCSFLPAVASPTIYVVLAIATVPQYVCAATAIVLFKSEKSNSERIISAFP
jgi:Na+-driven multidrug efflux pump